MGILYFLCSATFKGMGGGRSQVANAVVQINLRKIVIYSSHYHRHRKWGIPRG